MPQKVLVLGHGYVDFPDEATPEQITDTLRTYFPPPPMTVGEGAKSVLGSFAQGVTDTVASVPQSVGILQKAVTGSEEPVESTFPYRVGQGMSEGVAKALPVDPRMQGSFMWDTVPRGVGSTVGFGAMGALGSVARVPAVLGTMATGAAAQGVQGYQEAKQAGSNDSTAFLSFLANAGVGTSEALPIERILSRINKVSGGKLALALKAATSATEEGLQETGQQVAQNIIAQNLYDEDRKTLQDVAESGGAGALTGAFLHLVGHGANKALGRQTEAQDFRTDPETGKYLKPPTFTNPNEVQATPATATTTTEAPAAPVDPNAPATKGDIIQVGKDLAAQLQEALRGNQAKALEKPAAATQQPVVTTQQNESPPISPESAGNPAVEQVPAAPVPAVAAAEHGQIPVETAQREGEKVATEQPSEIERLNNEVFPITQETKKPKIEATPELLSDDEIPFSATAAEPQEPIDHAAHVDAITKAVEPLKSAFGDFAGINVVQKQSDAPAAIQKRAERLNGEWKAAVYGGQVYLNAETISGPEEAQKAVLHEVVGHRGLAEILKEEFAPFMEAVQRRFEGTPIWHEITSTYGLNTSSLEDMREAAEEVVARMAEQPDLDPGFWRSIVAAIQRAWRKITGGAISEGEIRQMIRRAYRHAESMGRSSEPGIRFSAEDDRRAFLRKQDEIQGKIRKAQMGGTADELRNLKQQMADLEQKHLGRSAKGETVEAQFTPEPARDARELHQKKLDVYGATKNPAPDSQTLWKRFKDGLKQAKVIPELPNTPEFAAMRRWFRAVKSETGYAREQAKRHVNQILAPLHALGRDKIDPNTVKEFQKLTDAIQQERAKGDQADSERVDQLTEKRDKLVAKLEQNPFWLFQSTVIARDLSYRANHLTTEDGNPITLPGGITGPEAREEVDRLQKLIEANPNSDAIKESLKRHYDFVEHMQAELERAGEIIPNEMKNPDYFPHHILDGWTGSLSSVRATTEGPWRYYLMPITGTEKLHQSDYLQAMYKHAADVLSNNAQVALVERDLKPFDISKEHEQKLAEKLGKEGAKAHLYDEEHLPLGYTVIEPTKRLKLASTYAIDRESLSKSLGESVASSGDLLTALKAMGADVKISAEDIRQALTSEKPVKWIVPTEVAQSLEGINKREEAEANPGFGGNIMKPLAKLQSVWKWNVLFNPTNWIRYEYGNIVTDVVDKVWGADPGMAKYFQRATKEVREAIEGNPSPEYDSALREGVMQTVTADEAGDLQKLKEFEMMLTDGEKSINNWNKLWRWTTGKSHMRESIFRYAKFLADLERLEKGERPVYAGAYHKEVDAQQTNVQKAALISRKTFGDYADIGVAGQFLRKYVFPFWSWQEVNLGYHANLFRNMVDMVKLGDILAAKQAGKAMVGKLAVDQAKAAVGIALRIAYIRLAAEMWNQFGGAIAGLWDKDDDLESQLSEADRRRMHIILGKDSNGKVRVMYVPNALADVTEWFGGNNFARLFMDWSKGDISFQQFATDYTKQVPADAINKVISQIRPEAKFAYSMASGKDPSDIVNQRKVDRGQWYWMLGQAMDRDIAMGLRSQLDPVFYSPESAGDWWQRKVLQVRKRDPENWAYYEVRQLADDWKETKTGKRHEGGDYMAPDSEVLRNFRKAIYRGDLENAEKFYAKALELGYTSERFQSSVRAQDPLNSLNKAERKEFLAELNPYQERMLMQAEKYYSRMMASKGSEKVLFPKKPSPTFTPNYGRLQSILDGRATMSDPEATDAARRLVEAAVRGR